MSYQNKDKNRQSFYKHESAYLQRKKIKSKLLGNYGHDKLVYTSA